MSAACPYCEAKNVAGHPVCAACGAILHGAAVDPPAARRPPGLRVPWRDWHLTHTSRARHAALQRRLEDALMASEERTGAALKADAPPPQARLDVAARHLLRDEVEAALQALHTAQHLGASGAEFANNAGVASARRGGLAQSLELFSQAAAGEQAGAAPAANTAAALAETWDDPDAAQKAMQAIRTALGADGKNPSHYSRLSQVFARDRRWPEAEAQARQALTLAGGDRDAQADARCALGVALLAAGCAEDAEREFDAALAASPGHAHALSDLGLLQVTGGDKARAAQGLQRLRDAAVIDPHSPGVQAGLGLGLCRAGAVNEGVRALRRALTRCPYLFEPCYNLGKAYADAGLPEVAAPYLTHAEQMRPQSCETLLTHGAVLVALKRPAQAVVCFERALALQPRSVSALTGLGVALALSGNHAEAERRLQAASRLDKDSPVIAGHRGWLHLLLDNASLAAAELELALKSDPDRAIFHNNYGLAQIALGAHEPALAHFQRAVALNPGLHAVHYHLGCTFALLKRVDEALAAWNAAAEYELTNADCFSNLGAAHFGKGDYDTAVSHFRRALQIRQDRALDYARLGLAYAQQGVVLKRSADSISKAAALLGHHGAEEKLKQAKEKHALAIAQFDTALGLDPGNVVLHSNRGLACFFIGEAEKAMQEWARVTQLDPLYARRRGKAQQQEFDASQMDFLPLVVPKRAQQRPLKSADYLPRFLGGYDADEWTLILSDPDLAPLPALLREARALERLLRALAL